MHQSTHQRCAVVKARSSYFVCATPRTGSTLLCDMLMNSGMAGYPEEYFEYLKETGLPRQPIEYFELRNEFLAGTVQEAKKRRSDHQRLKEWSSHGYASLAKVVLNARCTANGVFGAKMMWGYFGDFLSQMFATDVGDPNLSNERIQAFFPNLRYIWVRRKDSLLQAISLWKAIQTQCWRMDAGDGRDRKACNASFSYEAISYLQQALVEEDACWEGYFRRIGVIPIVVRYEELSANPTKVASSVLSQLGLPVEGEGIYSTMKRQRDGTSLFWKRMFLEAEIQQRAQDTLGTSM